MLLLLRLVLFSAVLVGGYYFPVPIAKKEAVRGVLERLPAWINDHFDFEIEDNMGMTADGARVYPENGKIFIQGGSGTTVLYAINHYLRNHCKTQITWDGNTYGNRCDDLLEEYYLEAPQVRYFGNQCTFAYSFAWWKWEDWEVFIDWLALNGFNMALASIGQEALWRDLYLELGLSRRDLDSYFTGPAYLAWHRMGNLKGYAGPVSDEFLDAQLELNKMIVARMASLGITPILPTFAGFVPDALAEMYPEKKSWEKQFIRNSCWDRFNSTYSCLASVKPLEDLFTEIGSKFLQKQLEAYGTLYHVYSADPMNEIPQRLTDITYLKNLAWSVHSSCMSGDNKCLWVMQSWTFSFDNWPKQSVKAFLSGIEPGRLLVLDLYAEHYPLWSHLKTFYGHPYVWSMLHNFGGNTEIRGNLRHPNKHYQVAMTSGIPMVGGGLTMEGIHQNYVIYQFMVDRMWSKQMIDIDPWIENYVLSRYQTDNETIVNAWKLIVRTLYSQPLNKSESLVHGRRFEEFVFKRPQLSQSIKYWFPMETLVEILNKFAFVQDSLSHNHLFRKDFKELTKVLLQYRLGNDYIMRVTEAIGLDDGELLHRECQNVEKIFDTLDTLSTYDYDEWEEAAISWGSTTEEQKLFAVNARLLVSIWGPTGENLDYAHRSWKGLIKKYYAPRWKFLCAWMDNVEHVKNQTMFAQDIFKSVEKVFVSLGRADVVPN